MQGLNEKVPDLTNEVPDLRSEVPDLTREVPDLRREVPDLRSGGIRPKKTTGFLAVSDISHVR